MEPIEPNSIKSFGYLFVIFLMLIFIFGYYLAEYGKRQARKAEPYNRLYTEIQVALYREVSEKNYYNIKVMMARLEGLDYKNKEATDVLNNQYMIKYQYLKRAIDSQDEFSVDETLRK